MKKSKPHRALPDPETKPDVPTWAEKLNILSHVRHQFHPSFLDAEGYPLAEGPREYLSLDLRCPLCKNIQPLGPPGVDHQCSKCHVHYKYTAAKGSCFLWIWRSKEVLFLKGDPSE